MWWTHAEHRNRVQMGTVLMFGGWGSGGHPEHRKRAHLGIFSMFGGWGCGGRALSIENVLI